MVFGTNGVSIIDFVLSSDDADDIDDFRLLSSNKLYLIFDVKY
jgi:hypothetical protein